MDTSVGDVQSIHTLISNDTQIKKLHKDELCACLKNTKLNFDEYSYIFQLIKSNYEIVDRLDIIRLININFGEMKNIEISHILELLRIFGKCIEWDAIDSIVEIIGSAFSSYKQKNNKNIEVLKAVRGYDFDLLYGIFNKISDENDSEAMSFAINERIHETKNKQDQDIFSYSLKRSNFNLIRFMIESGIDYTQKLLDISNKFYTKNAKYFFKIPQFDVNSKYEDNSTALIQASSNGHYEVVKLLLTVPGIDVNAKDCDNKTALIWASEYGRHEVVKLLLTVPGININAKDSSNNTSLHYASRYGHHEVVKLLLTVPGIDVNAKDNYNKTALIWASWNGHHEVVKLLLTVPGIDVNAKDNYNYTALHLASYNDHHEVVKLLRSVPGIDL